MTPDPGSIAIISACAAGSPKGNNRAVLDDLNKNGVDALIVSPFQIRADYGKWLALNFTKVIRDPDNIKKQATLLELFDQATALTAKEFPNDYMFDDMGLEFLIVGDPTIRLCKQSARERVLAHSIEIISPLADCSRSQRVCHVCT